jgi:hypothetical protein
MNEKEKAMRKIEQRMLAAIRSRRDWSEGNTEVSTQFQRVSIYLHGNRIAYMPNILTNVINPCNDMWRKWPTRTTASRLRALGFKYDKQNDCWE